MAIEPQRMSNVAWTIASHILMRNRCALDVSKFRWTKNQDVLIEKWIVERYDVALMVTAWTFQGQIYLYGHMIDFLLLLWSSCADTKEMLVFVRHKTEIFWSQLIFHGGQGVPCSRSNIRITFISIQLVSISEKYHQHLIHEKFCQLVSIWK